MHKEIVFWYESWALSGDKKNIKCWRQDRGACSTICPHVPPVKEVSVGGGQWTCHKSLWRSRVKETPELGLKQSRKPFLGLWSDMQRFITISLCVGQHCSQSQLWHPTSLTPLSKTLHGTNSNCSHHIYAKLMPDLKSKQHGIFADKQLQFLKLQLILFNCLLIHKFPSWSPK